MCYYLTSRISAKEIVQLEHDFVLDWDEPNLEVFYTVSGFSHPKLPVITDQKKSTKLSWGLIPPWVKDWNTAKKLRIQTLNAQSESIDTKPSFRSAVKAGQFCIVPVNGYFEWQHHANGNKYPYFIYPRNTSLFLLAGLYESWQDPITKHNVQTFTIVTTEANERMRVIHNTKKRMPLILGTENAKLWLDHEISFNQKKELMLPFDPNEMLDHTVGKLITSRKENPNQPAVTAPFIYEDLQPGLFDES